MIDAKFCCGFKKLGFNLPKCNESNKKLENLGWVADYNLDDGIVELMKGYKIIRPNRFANA